MRKLSFIVPLYNSSKWMRKCVDSLLEQDVPKEEYEIILVDDGSPDDSGQIAEEYADKYPNIRVIHQENKGASGARNTGLRAADSKYIWLVDPDDYIESNCLSKLSTKIEEEDLDILRFGYRLVDEDYKEVKKHPSELRNDYTPKIFDGDDFLNERMGIACYIWTFIFKLSIIKDNNIYCYEGDYYDDTPWTPRVIRAASRIDSTPDICYNYLQRENSLVRNKNLIEKQIIGYQFLLEELPNQKKVASEAAKKWYDRMIAHCVVSLMVSYSSNRSWEEIISLIRNLERSNFFPLYKDKTDNKLRKKIDIINFSPILFCLAIKIKRGK